MSAPRGAGRGPDPGDPRVQYEFIDLLPKRLFDPTVNHLHGALRPRALAVIALRNALLSGWVVGKEAMAWPEQPYRQALLESLSASGIARFCDANPEVTDDVILLVLEAVGRCESRFVELEGELAGEATLRRAKTRTVALRRSDMAGKPGEGAEVLLDDATWEHIRRDAERLAAETAVEALKQHVELRWGERLRLWSEIEQVLNGLCERANLGPRAARSMLRSLDWRDSARLRRVIACLPALVELVRSLGRLDGSNASDERGFESILGPIRRPAPRARAIAEGGVETRGVERSGEIERMLPSEAVLLTHPVLRLLWHARRAERALLTYHAESVLTTRIQTEQGYADGLEDSRDRAERGPIIIVLDTSASMIGPPEILAKAIVLQVLSVAHLERRPCCVFNFSSSGQLVEHDLSLEGDGLAEALAFLTLSFHGGTDIDEACRRAVLRLGRERWAYADVLFVTDGLIDVDDSSIRLVKALRRENGVRFHAALTLAVRERGVHEDIMDLSSHPLHPPGHVWDPHQEIKQLCDHIHDVSHMLDSLQPVD